MQKHTHTKFGSKICIGETTLKIRVQVEENIKMSLKAINVNRDVNWNILAQNRDQKRGLLNT